MLKRERFFQASILLSFILHRADAFDANTIVKSGVQERYVILEEDEKKTTSLESFA